MAETDAKPNMKILSQFVRDLSFENIGAQKGMQPDVQPQISVNVNMEAQDLKEGRYMIALKTNATAKVGEETLFIAEVDYAGIFQLNNLEQNQIHPFLMIECPRFIFPFVRRIVADLTRDGGYPPLMLDNVDFVSLYRQELERRQAAAADGGEGGEGEKTLN